MTEEYIFFMGILEHQDVVVLDLGIGKQSEGCVFYLRHHQFWGKRWFALLSLCFLILFNNRDVNIFPGHVFACREIRCCTRFPPSSWVRMKCLPLFSPLLFCLDSLPGSTCYRPSCYCSCWTYFLPVMTKAALSHSITVYSSQEDARAYAWVRLFRKTEQNEIPFVPGTFPGETMVYPSLQSCFGNSNRIKWPCECSVPCQRLSEHWHLPSFLWKTAT